MKFYFELISALFVLQLSKGLSKSCGYDVFVWANHDNPENGYWKHFNWDIITTIGFFGNLDDEPLAGIREYAHSLNVKLVKAVGISEVSDVNNQTARTDYINSLIADAINQKYDGVNFDYEGHDPSIYEGFNALMTEASEAFHAAIPGSEVSADVSIYPDYEYRNLTFNYKQMADSLDYLFIMAYDSEFWLNIQCINQNIEPACSQACAPYDVALYGVEAYINLGINSQKLYLGLPWYGLKYEMVRNIPIMAGQIDFSDAKNLVRSRRNANVTFDESSKSWILNCGGLCNPKSLNEKEWYSYVWFDDHESLAPKYAIAKEYQLKGVGMWDAGKLRYSGSALEQTDAKLMWDALCQ
jgi:spore germination protein YaaH